MILGLAENYFNYTELLKALHITSTYSKQGLLDYWYKLVHWSQSDYSSFTETTFSRASFNFFSFPLLSIRR
jgi:hypothetical protein